MAVVQREKRETNVTACGKREWREMERESPVLRKTWRPPIFLFVGLGVLTSSGRLVVSLRLAQTLHWYVFGLLFGLGILRLDYCDPIQVV